MATTIEFRTTDYLFSHGHTPRGRGSWAFTTRGRPEMFWSPGSTTYAEAKRLAREEARKVAAAAAAPLAYIIINVEP